MFFAIAYQRDVGTTIVWQSGEYSGAVSRYVIVPALLLLSAALALIDSALRDRAAPRAARRGRSRSPLRVIVAVDRDLLLPGRTGGAGDARLGRRASKKRRANARPGGGGEVAVQTSPPGFGVLVPCDKIPESLGGPPSS